MFAKIRRHLRRSIYQYIGWLIVTVFLITACHNQVPHTPKASTDCRMVNTALGETCVPTHPQRVIALDLLDNLLSLGIKPVGATVYDGHFRTSLPAEKSVGIQSVGTLGQPNIESILQLKPDLILTTHWGRLDYKQLSQIAPVVAAGDGKNIDWKGWLKTYGAALGKQAEVEAIIDKYYQRVAEFRQQMGERLSQTQVSVIMSWGGYRTYMNKSFSGQILRDIGLPRPPIQDQDKVNEDISLELIPRMEGDVIFLAVGGNEPSIVKSLLNHPLWSQLKAVQEGKVYQVDADAWIAGYGPVGANVVLDDLFKYLINTP
ncbi:MAG: ABC transporter substrate-binding protein [Nodularia sp. (in: Bacteria)]|nr:MAG: ABC transporter substrate-binding protein [Nodularia sp. (in: cyanobacteria)]